MTIKANIESGANQAHEAAAHEKAGRLPEAGQCYQVIITSSGVSV
jgi:hypothetical protein